MVIDAHGFSPLACGAVFACGPAVLWAALAQNRCPWPVASPWPPVKVLRGAGEVQAGAAVCYRAGLGPVGVNWELKVSQLTPGEGWVEEQGKGPFGAWRHQRLLRPHPWGCLLLESVSHRTGGALLLVDRLGAVDHWALTTLARHHRWLAQTLGVQHQPLLPMEARELAEKTGEIPP